ncbi:MAG: YtxH domain-containing protein [Thermoleophilia bacterium]
MPRFTKFLFGGVIGAGLALMFAPKTGREMRRMFMGGGRPALPPPQPSTAPAPGRPIAAGEVSLESRIEETRRQVESQLASTAAEAPAAPVEEALVEVTEAAMIEEDFVVEEAPVEAVEPLATPQPEAAVPVEAPVAEAVFEAEPEAEEVAEAEVEPEAEEVAEAEVEPEAAVEFPSEEAEAALAEEELAAAQDESAFAEEISRQQEAEIEVEQEASGRFPKGQTLAELAQEHGRTEEAGETASGEFDALRTPAEGEPTIGEVQPVDEAPREPERPQPSRLDQDEMRRRINETRDRLKAKAFDAMVSGETFIETEADKARKHGKPDSPKLGDEVEKQIEESLKEEY